MITLTLTDIEETQEFEFVVNGERRMSVSVNPHNLSVQIPGGVKPESINNGSSFFLRTRDWK